MDCHFLFLKFPLGSAAWPAELGEAREEEHWSGLRTGLQLTAEPLGDLTGLVFKSVMEGPVPTVF